MGAPLDPTVRDRGLALYLEGKTLREVSEALGVTLSTVRSWYYRDAWAQAKDPGHPDVPTAPIPSGHRVKGVSTLVDKDGRTRAQWVKTTAPQEDREAVLVRLLRDLPEIVPARTALAPATDPATDDLLAVYPLGDPHFGMLSWGRETGADWDLEIAEDTFLRAIRDLVLRGPRTRRALLVNLGDFFHYDNDAGHTTNGAHALDSDSRPAKVLRVGFRAIVAMTEALAEHHPEVVVDCQIGNHDAHTALMLAIGLGAYFRNAPHVQVLQDPSVRHYHEFGRNLIGTTHGDRAKAQDLAEIMAAERPEAWGRTAHRTWLVGHVHHQTVKEYRGCRVETFRTLAARDSWHARQGYLSGRDLHRILLHREHGEIAREVCSVGYLMGATSRHAP